MNKYRFSEGTDLRPWIGREVYLADQVDIALEAIEARCRELEAFTEEIAGLDCTYGKKKNCGKCLYCRARAILQPPEAQEGYRRAVEGAGEMKVKCNKCGYVGDESEFKKGRDFFQNKFIAGCPKCDNRQSPGDASMRAFGGERPFVFIREQEPADPMGKVFHRADEAS